MGQRRQGWKDWVGKGFNARPHQLPHAYRETTFDCFKSGKTPREKRSRGREPKHTGSLRDDEDEAPLPSGPLWYLRAGINFSRPKEKNPFDRLRNTACICRSALGVVGSEIQGLEGPGEPDSAWTIVVGTDEDSGSKLQQPWKSETRSTTKHHTTGHSVALTHSLIHCLEELLQSPACHNSTARNTTEAGLCFCQTLPSASASAPAQLQLRPCGPGELLLRPVSSRQEGSGLGTLSKQQ